MSHDSSSRNNRFPDPEERFEHGRALRKTLKRTDHGSWTIAPDRGDPVALLMRENMGRQEHLLHIKFDKMKDSAFGFFRGAAPLMARDLASTPSTGIPVQICGDAHVKNLGAYASDVGRLVFDINDFDETITGPWEWDVKRLAASVVLAGMESKSSNSEVHEAVLGLVRSYRIAAFGFATMSAIGLMRCRISRGDGNGPVHAVLRDAERATPMKTLKELTRPQKNGLNKFLTNKKLKPVDPKTRDAVIESLDSYRGTLGAGRRLTLKAYRWHDVAFKIVGTGSVGTLDYVILLYGNGPDDPMFLQVKQSVPSCYAHYLPNAPKFENQGERVACGQYCIQSVTDPFVGWTRIGKDDFLVRQLADHKASVDPAQLKGSAMTQYAEVCGEILAKAHARTGDAAMIAGYCGDTDKFDLAISQFAFAYAEQTRKDYQEFCKHSNNALLKMVPAIEERE